MFDSFFISEVPINALQGGYTPYLVLVSYAVAAFASYTGLALAEEAGKAQKEKLKAIIYLVGGIAMGGGIWSMHFIGMLAFHMDGMPMSYEPKETVLSLLIAIAIAFGVFRMTRTSKIAFPALAGRALLLGTAICGMHYTGMAAMRMELVSVSYLPSLFFLSVVIAVAASGAALWIFIYLARLGDGRGKTLLRGLAGLVMGAGICGMHFTGMLAAVFIPAPNMCVTAPLSSAQGHETLALWLTAVTGAILGISLSLTLFNRGKSFFSARNARHAFPVRLLGSSMCLTLLSLAWLEINSYSMHRSITHIREHSIAATELSTQVIYLDDVRSEDLENAIQTRSAALRSKYTSDVQSLADTIALIRRKYGNDQTLDHITGMEAANHNMATKESEVLRMLRRGDSFHANALLDGAEYQEYKRVFTTEANKFAQEASRFIRQQLLEFSENLYLTILLFVISLPVQMVIWLFTLQSLRHWRRELVMAQVAAEAASRSKSDFLANMSHELRTPMNGILGLTQLLVEGEKLPEQEQLLDAVKKSAESLLFLLNDILDFSKIEAGQLTLEEAPFNLRDGLKNVIDLLSAMASKKGLVLKYKFDDKAPACAVGDALRINQIATNLIGNAIKFTGEGSVDLAVSAEQSGDGRDWLYFLTVTDTGVGIPPDKRDRLFHKFSQADTSTTRKYGGTGLGLAIAKMLAEKMHGTISFVSMPGVGTIFTVTLLLQAAASEDVVQAGKGETQAPHSAEDFSRFRVLLVDDHPVNRLFAQKLLRKMGFAQVEEAVDGREALDKIQGADKPYNLVLMDCQMPEMDGFEAVRRIRARERAAGTKAIPVIAMTAHAMEGDRNECLEAGMDDYISKPVNPGKLRNVLCRQLLDTDGGKSRKAKVAVPVIESARRKGKAVIDMEHLALFTEGDMDMEELLANTFISSGKETLEALKEHIEGKGSDEDWRKASHKLKGSAAQIGAAGLSGICLAAETGSKAAPAVKRGLLSDMQRGFGEIESFFAARMAGRLAARAH